MANRKQIESAGGDPVANPDNAPQQGQTELPLVDSPSLSPATSDVASEPVAELPVSPSKPDRRSARRTSIIKKSRPTLPQQRRRVRDGSTSACVRVTGATPCLPLRLRSPPPSASWRERR